MKNKLPAKIITVAVLTFIIVCVTCLAIRFRNNSIKDKHYKTDYFTVNQIKYGLLSGNNWSWQVHKIVEMQVDSFHFTAENKEVLTKQLNALLSRVLDEANHVLHKKQKNAIDRIKFKVINAFVDVHKFKKEVPRFSNAIVDELDKSENKEELKNMIKEKVTGILNITNQDTAGEQHQVIARYHFSNIEDFNKFISQKTVEIREEQRVLGYTLIGLLLFTLLTWVAVIRLKILYSFTFLASVIISCITLLVGISLPMIEIDARIATLDLKLLSSHILFKDQVIFFQTKSIIDVVHILLTNGKADTIFVGCLIFLFSVLFPITKLISASIYLFIKERSNGFIRYMAFKSGKWSMADVMVVAIFMAYVGFQGILNNQLEDINMQNETLNLISTNRSNLQTGFLIFVSFVIFNLILAEFLKKVTKKDECSIDESSSK